MGICIAAHAAHFNIATGTANSARFGAHRPMPPGFSHLRLRKTFAWAVQIALLPSFALLVPPTSFGAEHCTQHAVYSASRPESRSAPSFLIPVSHRDAKHAIAPNVLRMIQEASFIAVEAIDAAPRQESGTSRIREIASADQAAWKRIAASLGAVDPQQQILLIESVGNASLLELFGFVYANVFEKETAIGLEIMAAEQARRTQTPMIGIETPDMRATLSAQIQPAAWADYFEYLNETAANPQTVQRARAITSDLVAAVSTGDIERVGLLYEELKQTLPGLDGYFRTVYEERTESIAGQLAHSIQSRPGGVYLIGAIHFAIAARSILEILRTRGFILQSLCP